MAARLRAGYENEGLSLRELAARERFSRETVRMLLREAGTQLRPGGGASSGGGPSVESAAVEPGSSEPGPGGQGQDRHVQPHGSAGESSSSAGGGPTRWEKGKWRAGQVPSAVERARQIAREMNLHYVGVGAGEAGAAREAHERNLNAIADRFEREGEEAARRLARELRETDLYRGSGTRPRGFGGAPGDAAFPSEGGPGESSRSAGRSAPGEPGGV